MDLRKWIRDIPDFPVKGIIFRDITPLLKDPEAFREAINMMKEKVSDIKMDLLVAPEARGFIFAAALAYDMKKGFVPVRKPGKLPYKTVSIEYDLEYGKAELHMHEDAIRQGDRVLIVDDVLATGGTVSAIAKLVEEQGGVVAGILALAELSYLNPRARIGNYRVETLIVY